MKPLYIESGQDENGNAPICPHCQMEMKQIKVHRSHYKFLSNLHVFCCPECGKALGLNIVAK